MRITTQGTEFKDINEARAVFSQLGCSIEDISLDNDGFMYYIFPNNASSGNKNIISSRYSNPIAELICNPNSTYGLEYREYSKDEDTRKQQETLKKSISDYVIFLKAQERSFNISENLRSYVIQ